MTRSLVVALLALSTSATNWTQPQVLSNGAIALGPELALSSSGAALAVWDHELGADCAQTPASLTCAHIVEFAARTPGGGWSWPEGIARPGIGARPGVALNDVGRAAVIWVHDIGRDRVVQATYRVGARDPFPNPSDLSAAVLEVRSHHIGLDAAGNAVAVWAERHASDFDVAGEMRDVASGTWRAPVVLSTAAVRAGPELAVSQSGDAYAVWVEGHVVKVVRGYLRTGAWEAPLVLSSDAGADAAVAVNAVGDAVAAWTLQDRPGIEVAAHPHGGSWSTPAAISDASGAPATAGPDIGVADDGTAVAVWVDGRGALQSAVGSRGGTVALSAADPHIDVDPSGNAVVVWREGGRLLAAARPSAAAAWQPAEELSGADISDPQVALDATGNGVAVWNLRNGDLLPVMTANLPAAWTPTLANTRRPSIRGRARVGRTLICDRGEWAGTVPIRYAYGWLRNGRPRGSGSRYRIRHADAGARVSCRVAATNAARTLVATSPSIRVSR